MREITPPDRSDDLQPKPTFLLVHGFAQNQLAYTLGGLPSALLSRGARVFVGEFRGHGQSQSPSGPITLATLLECDLPALVQATHQWSGASRIHLVGHSMGGILGYGLLARSHRLASLTTLAAPLSLGDGKPVLRTAARLASPWAKYILPEQVPMDRFLRRVARVTSTVPGKGLLAPINELWRLANPDNANPQDIMKILQSAGPTSRELLMDLIRLASGGPTCIGHLDLKPAILNSKLPIAAVVAEKDIFAGPKSVRPIAQGCGPRRIIVLPKAAHIDITMGKQCEDIVQQLWSFLTESA